MNEKTYSTLNKRTRRPVKVGTLNSSGVFQKFVKHSIHFLHKYKAYGISDVIVEDLKKDGCERIEIYDGENMLRWSVSFKLFYEKGWVWTYGDYEPQKFLEKRWWNIYTKNGEQMQKGQRPEDISLLEENSVQKKLI